MDANNFVARLKANGTENDLCDLKKVIDEYKEILSRLPSKDRSSFCLNVLSILCRNLDKVPTWRDNIDPTLLITLSIDCVRETVGMKRTEQVKVLACVYHIHRYIVRLKRPIPPKLVLHMSYVPFARTEDMLQEYAKTYWSILADRITYIESLKNENISIVKLLQKLTEDTLKIIQIYDTAQFCVNILTFLVKKLHFLYSDLNSVELNHVYGQVFDSLAAKNDLNSLKKLSYKELLDLYIKFNDCFYVIVKNSWRNLKDSVLTQVVSNCVSILGHCLDMCHCLQTFYLDTFCVIFKMTSDELMFKKLLDSCEQTAKSEHSKLMYVTYPFLNQLIRLYMDYLVANVNDWSKNFTGSSQEYCLKLILLIMKKSKNCQQLLKCDNCMVRSGLHDSLRLSFLSIHFVKLSDNIANILPVYHTVIKEQHAILKELRTLGCSNYEKCYRKLQTDIHNTAIVLNKSQNYEYSIKLFDIYLMHEIGNFKDKSDLKNISRALYNKSICELDCKKYEDALKNAFLSLVFACPEGLNSDKYMSLVMDIKAKALKASEDDESQDELQLMSVLEACKVCSENKWYGNLRPFYAPLKFSALLRHEFAMYCRLWPSIVPIAGVLRALRDLARNAYAGTASAENEDAVMSILYDVILETSAAVRSIHSDHYKEVVSEVVAMFDATPATSTELQLAQAALLLLKAELELHDAGEKHGWKLADPTQDPDDAPVSRTISQEHEATRHAIQAVHLMTDLLPDITTVAVTNRVTLVLEMASIFVQQLLQLGRRTHGLQLALTCCVLARHVGDQKAYMMNAGVLISHADKHTDKQVINDLVKPVACARSLADDNPEHVDTAVVFICDVAIYKFRAGAVGAAASLLRVAQTEIQKCMEKDPNVNLDWSVGRVLQAQGRLRARRPGALGAANNAQRHYLSMTNTASSRHARRLFSVQRARRAADACARGVLGARALRLARRARAWAARAAPHAAGAALAALHASTTDLDCVKIDNRLKYTLGMQTNESCARNSTREIDAKPEMFTPKPDVEVMLENISFKKRLEGSPSMPCVSVPGVRTPAFLNHTDCDCYACEIPQCHTLAAFTVGLEAVMYFRATETDIARNYFDGAFKCFQLAEKRLKEFNVKTCEKFILEAVKSSLLEELKSCEVEILIEAAFFELSISDYEKADEIVVRIHDILDEYDIDCYLRNDVMNLMVASAETRRNVKKNVDTGLEAEFESLKLPANMEPPKTPETKAKAPPKIPKIIVKDEELPKKRKVIKLNLDEADQKEKETKKKPDFKVPTPATKLTLELMTPRHTRAKPYIFVSQPSDDFKTPIKEVSFSTPASTSDEFFTPMSTLKTYAGKSLRQNIVKNLETEFSTPKGNIEVTVEPKSNAKNKDSKKTLRRATSPGKLVKAPTSSARTTRRTHNRE